MGEKLLTVGMAVYREFEDVWHTLESLNTFHGTWFNIVVVDNAPSSCLRTKATVSAVGGRYFHRPDLNGTARPRSAVFDFATTPWVLVCDSHVHFEPGALKALEDYIRTNPESKDILSGPIVGDDGKWQATHWELNSNGGLWGTWANNPSPEPFEIPAQGLGCFAMRREAWPGFHPLMRGFGGEEGYIHEKVRRLGGKAVCLPKLRWRHRFRNVIDFKLSPPPYAVTAEDHARNLLIGHRELGIPDYENLIRNQAGLNTPRQAFTAATTEVKIKVTENFPRSLPKGVRVLGVWYSNNSAPPEVLEASLRSIKTSQDQTTRHDVRVITCPWKTVRANPFPEVIAAYRDKYGHAMIVSQINQALKEGTRDGWTPDVVCFLEHDVLYAPGYFDRVVSAVVENPGARVISHLDYIGLNATGWLRVKDRHEPLHQLSMTYQTALKNLDRAENDCVRQGWTYLEPDHAADRSTWVRIPPDGYAPSVHINHTGGRLTSHGETVFEAVSSYGPKNSPVTIHPYWGDMKLYYPTPTQTATQVKSGGCPSCSKTKVSAPATKPKRSEPVAKLPAVKRPVQLPQPKIDIRDLTTDESRTVTAYASKSHTVTLISVWNRPFHTAVLAGLPSTGVLVSKSIVQRRWWPELTAQLGDRFVTVIGRKTKITATDTLILDTNPDSENVYAELKAYAEHVNKYIIVSGTTLYADVAANKKDPGVMDGVRRFVTTSPEWTAVTRVVGGQGLLVLSRLEEDRKQPPGMITKALNFSKALIKHAADGNRIVSDKVWELRMAECLVCDQRNIDTCAACGCTLADKASWASEECGMSKIGKEPKWKALTE